MDDSTPRGSGPDPDPAAESSAALLQRARKGDKRAENALFERHRPVLMRLAHGRLPVAVRGLVDSADLVQETMLRAFRHLDGFEDRGEGAFLGWLREILKNHICDVCRRAKRQPDHTALHDGLPAVDRTPLEMAIGRDAMSAYESALEQLSEHQRHAVVLRVELGYSYDEVALALGRPSAEAARMLVVRALRKLAVHMGRERAAP